MQADTICFDVAVFEIHKKLPPVKTEAGLYQKRFLLQKEYPLRLIGNFCDHHSRGGK